MNDNKNYNTVEIHGSFLVPCFSIYLLEISKEDKKWFYIGMTGDPYYPSARSAFHRIAGHLELNNRSTQNQLLIAMKEKLGLTESDLKEINIKMHHFPIEGFKIITDKQLSTETMKELRTTEDYKTYKKIQRQVLTLENQLIYELKDRLLNKTKGKRIKSGSIPFPEIYNNIIGLVYNE